MAQLAPLLCLLSLGFSNMTQTVQGELQTMRATIATSQGETLDRNQSMRCSHRCCAQKPTATKGKVRVDVNNADSADEADVDSTNNDNNDNHLPDDIYAHDPEVHNFRVH